MVCFFNCYVHLFNSNLSYPIAKTSHLIFLIKNLGFDTNIRLMLFYNHGMGVIHHKHIALPAIYLFNVWIFHFIVIKMLILFHHKLLFLKFFHSHVGHSLSHWLVNLLNHDRSLLYKLSVSRLNVFSNSMLKISFLDDVFLNFFIKLILLSYSFDFVL